jgi:hypothetical protein
VSPAIQVYEGDGVEPRLWPTPKLGFLWRLKILASPVHQEDLDVEVEADIALDAGHHRIIVNAWQADYVDTMLRFESAMALWQRRTNGFGMPGRSRPGDEKHYRRRVQVRFKHTTPDNPPDIYDGCFPLDFESAKSGSFMISYLKSLR